MPAPPQRKKRRDALQGAAAFIILAHKLITEEYPEGVINCGHVSVKPDTFNVVPAEASLRVEFRHPDPAMLTEMEARLIRLTQDCAKSYRLSVGVDRVSAARSRADVAGSGASFRASLPTGKSQLYDHRQL